MATLQTRITTSLRKPTLWKTATRDDDGALARRMDGIEGGDLPANLAGLAAHWVGQAHRAFSNGEALNDRLEAAHQHGISAALAQAAAELRTLLDAECERQKVDADYYRYILAEDE